ncbi:MAG TPA: hypothetical protein PK929_18370, partial [Quisquiliibacterium sp.]|nr:hypothetical protein [Quisquiliibacterium sp.]
AAILAEARFTTIERLARLLDEARAAIDDDDCLRYANVPGRNLRASHDDARRKDGPKTDANAQAGADASPAPANVSSVAAIPLDPDKAQAARAALRAHRCQGRN